MTRRPRAALCGVLVWAAAWACPASTLAQSAAAASLPERGRAVYRGAGPRDIAARIDGTEVPLTHRRLRCAQCHGADGRGGREGGTAAPSLRWEALTHAAGAKGAPRYDARAFRTAVADGRGRDGRVLSAVMPRFALDDSEVAGLVAYLQALDTETVRDPGLSDSTIRLGVVVPSRGGLAALGTAVADALRAFAVQANARGGIYGRRLEMVVAECDSTVASALAATRTLADSGDVFALVATADVWPGNEIRAIVEGERLPSIGPLTFVGRPPHRDSVTLDVLASTADQVEALVEHLSAAGIASVTVVNDGTVTYATLAYDVERHARRRGMVATTMSVVDDRLPQVIGAAIALGRGDLLVRVVKATASTVVVGGVLGLSAEGLEKLDLGDRSRVRLVSPTLPLTEDAHHRLDAAMRATGREVTSPEVQAVAWSSAELTVAALIGAGRSLDRDTFMAALARLDRVATLALPAVAARANGLQAPRGAVLVGLDAQTARPVVLSEWLGLQRVTR